MKAGYIEAPYKAYFREMEEPQITKENEVKIRVKYSGICGSEIHAYHGTHRFRIPPLVSGHECSGIITEIGSNVTNYKPGDRVIAEPQYGCGTCPLCLDGKYNICPDKKVLGATYWSGSFGEYVVVPEQTLVPLPDSISFELGALTEPLAVGLHAVKISNCTEGKTILIIGSGTIGMSTLLFAKIYGASTILLARRNFYLEKATMMGCDFVINSQTENLRERLMSITGGKGVDITYVCFGNEKTIAEAAKYTKPGGLICIVALMNNGLGFPYGTLVSKELTAVGSNMYVHEDFEDVLNYILQGKIHPEHMISRIYPIEKITEALDFCDKRPEPAIKTLLKF